MNPSPLAVLLSVWAALLAASSKLTPSSASPGALEPPAPVDDLALVERAAKIASLLIASSEDNADLLAAIAAQREAFETRRAAYTAPALAPAAPALVAAPAPAPAAPALVAAPAPAPAAPALVAAPAPALVQLVPVHQVFAGGHDLTAFHSGATAAGTTIQAGGGAPFRPKVEITMPEGVAVPPVPALEGPSAPRIEIIQSGSGAAFRPGQSLTAPAAPAAPAASSILPAASPGVAALIAQLPQDAKTVDVAEEAANFSALRDAMPPAGQALLVSAFRGQALPDSSMVLWLQQAGAINGQKALTQLGRELAGVFAAKT
jgi:hypothetical protein